MMSDFVKEFIDVKEKGIQLIRCLLGLIQEDSSISPSDVFFIKNSKAITKAELITMDCFTIEPFLLSIWHYIIMNRFDKNEKGVDTYKSWYVDRDCYRGTVGNDIDRSITIKSFPIIDDTESAANEQNSTKKQMESESTENIQHIEHATIVNQYGEKCVHIDHVEVLNL